MVALIILCTVTDRDWYHCKQNHQTKFMYQLLSLIDSIIALTFNSVIDESELLIAMNTQSQGSTNCSTRFNCLFLNRKILLE